MNDATTIHSVDGKPLRAGQEVFLVREAHLNHYGDSDRKAEPMRATVVRVTDGDHRSVLLRLENGAETRWYPKRGHIETEALFVAQSAAETEARRRNDSAADKYAAELKACYERLRAWRASTTRRCVGRRA